MKLTVLHPSTTPLGAHYVSLYPSNPFSSPPTKWKHDLTSSPGYESSPSAGDAACSYNSMVYPDSGKPYKISEPPANSHHHPATSSSSANAIYGAGISNSTSSKPSASASVMPYKPGTTGVPFTGAAGRLEKSLVCGGMVGAGAVAALAWL